MNIPVFGILSLFIILMIGFYFLNERREGDNLRDIPAFYHLQGAIELAVEDGTRIHVALGRSEITSPQSMVAMVGLSMLKKISLVSVESDNPPIASAGSGGLAIPAQDTLRGTYDSLGVSALYDHHLGRVTGLTPYSFAAGTMPIIIDEDVTANVMIGSFGDEAALITSAAERSRTFTVAGTDNIPGQAVLYASAHEPLIGEELFAGGAYIGAGKMHIASLHAQDVLRWIIIVFILVGSILSLMLGLF
jgi:hypothetical protein